MSKRVFIALLQTCMIAGLPRSPAEGLQEVDSSEAKRLVDLNMAEYADMNDDTDDGDETSDAGDGLDKKSVKELAKLAQDEGATIKARANKSELLAGIRAHRQQIDAKVREDAKAQLASFDRDKLIEIAEAEGVEFGEDATDDALREAIFANTFPPAV